MWEKHWSEGIAREAVWISGVVDGYAEAEKVMNRIGHVWISDTTIWRRVERWGPVFRELDQQRKEAAQAAPKRGRVMAGQVKKPGQIGAGMDGAMVHIRQEGWKELKVGCLFDIEMRSVFDQESQEWLELAKAVNNDYVAHLGGPEYFGQLMWAQAQARDWEAYYDTQIIGDGAPWIWNQTAEHFFDSHQTLDWYHALEHLHTAAQLYQSDDPEAAKRWVKTAETTLFQGHADRIADQLRGQALGQSQRAKDLRTEANFFQNHKRRMQYLEFREAGYPIGSGMVESGAKQFKARFTGPGMRWSREGLENLLPIRSAILSDLFDDLWPQVYRSP